MDIPDQDIAHCVPRACPHIYGQQGKHPFSSPQFLAHNLSGILSAYRPAQRGPPLLGAGEGGGRGGGWGGPCQRRKGA